MIFSKETKEKLRTGCTVVGCTYLAISIIVTVITLTNLQPRYVQFSLSGFSIKDYLTSVYLTERTQFWWMLGYIYYLCGAVIVLLKSLKYFFVHRRNVDNDEEAFAEYFYKYEFALSLILRLIFFTPAIIPTIIQKIMIINIAKPIVQEYKDNKEAMRENRLNEIKQLQQRL